MDENVVVGYDSVDEYAQKLFDQSEDTNTWTVPDYMIDSESTIPANQKAHWAWDDDTSKMQAMQARGIKESENLKMAKDTILKADEDLANS